jgi:hypothetical protein
VPAGRCSAADAAIYRLGTRVRNNASQTTKSYPTYTLVRGVNL